MIGFIVTGHGEFATGITSSLEMIGGVQEQYEKVVFLAENPLEQLSEELLAAIKKVDSGEGVVVFTDLKGGTPFNEAIKISFTNPDVHVVAGTNLPMLLEGSFSRTDVTDVKAFLDQLVATGQEQVQRFELPTIMDDGEL